MSIVSSPGTVVTSTADWSDRLVLPVVAAPMTGVSGPALVAAACANGVIGAFPTHNAPTTAVLEEWLVRMQAQSAAMVGTGRVPAPIAANVVVHRSNPRRDDDIAVIIRSGVEVVITSVGSPKDVIGPLHDAGITVFADVATLRHAERAAACGVDGLVLLAAGAGGQTGSANPFAFTRAVRDEFDGTLILAGGISDGAGVAAAQALGADLVYLGTRFIPTVESLATPEYQAALVAATLDDVTTSSQVSGLATNILTDWLDRHTPSGPQGEPSTNGFAQSRLLDGREVWAAGHSVSGTNAISPVSVVIDQLVADHRKAIENITSAVPTRR